MQTQVTRSISCLCCDKYPFRLLTAVLLKCKLGISSGKTIQQTSETHKSLRYQCTYTSLRIQTRLIAPKVILFTVDLLQVSLFFTAGVCAFWDSCGWEEQVCGLLPLSFDNHNWWDVFFLTFYLKFRSYLPPFPQDWLNGDKIICYLSCVFILFFRCRALDWTRGRRALLWRFSQFWREDW